MVVGDRLLEEEDLTEGKDKKGKGSGTKDACYHKVKSRYSVWPSAYASGALVKCRKVGAANWGNKSEEVEVSGENLIERGISHSMGRQPGGMEKFMADRDKRKEAAKEIMKNRKQPAQPAPMADHYDWRSTLDEKCWAGYEKKGMKTMFGKRYPNCVKKSKKKK